MLRAVRLKNYVNFREDQFLLFEENGVYFFIGQNGSGKSSVFEAIEQCLNPTFDTSFSQIPNEPTYIICKYDIPENDKSCFKTFETIITSFVHIPGTNTKFKSAKVVSQLKGSENAGLYIDLYVIEDSSQEAKRPLHISLTDTKQSNEITECHRNCIKDKDAKNIQEFIKAIRNLLELPEAEINGASSNVKSGCISDHLAKRLLFTFGGRSLGRSQWSKITQMQTENQDSICKDGKRNCEIINYFLSSDSSYNKEEESKYFMLMSDGANYSVNVNVDNKSKISEGIMEAKSLSLLLTSTEFYTIFMEEPDRGMHPQMIQTIRDFILPKVKEKTIIIVTHNSRLMSSWSIPRTYKFVRTEKENKCSCKIDDIGRYPQDAENKTVRLLASEDYVSLVFARTLIFVEGLSDFLFVKALIAHIMDPKNNDTVKNVLPLLCPDVAENQYDDELQRIRTSLVSLQVVKMDGEKRKKTFHDLSDEYFGVSKLFLLDRDAFVTVKWDADMTRTEAILEEETKRLVSDLVSGRLQQSPPQLNHQTLTNNIINWLKEQRDNSDTNNEQGTPNDSNAKEQWENMIKLLEWDNSNTIKQPTAEWKVEYTRTRDQYYNSIKNGLLNKYCKVKNGIVNVPIMKDKKDDLKAIVHSTLAQDFKTNVEAYKWEEAAKCLEKEDVFVWRTGTLEDAFRDLLMDPIKRNGIRFETKIIETIFMQFYNHHINLNEENKTKLYMDDKISDKDISASICLALKYIREKSDITYFLQFLVRKR